MGENADLRPMMQKEKANLNGRGKFPRKRWRSCELCWLQKTSRKTLAPSSRIYQIAFTMFSDLPRGHHKNNSMHKMASKTMVEILPADIIAHIEKKCGSIVGADFYDVVGNMSWYEPENQPA